MDGKQIIALVTISVVLVLLLKNSGNTNAVINGLAGGAAQDISVLQGNPYSGSGLGNLGATGSGLPGSSSLGG